MEQGEKKISSDCSMARESLVIPGSLSSLAKVRMILSSLQLLGLEQGR